MAEHTIPAPLFQDETATNLTEISSDPAKKKRNLALDNLIDVLCGSAAGSAGKLIEYPFDTVKVRLQSQPDHLPPQFKGPLDCFRQTFQSEGFSGFYRGISSPIVGAALENASLFLTYNAARGFIAKNWYHHPDGTDFELPFSTLLLCGSFSGVVTSFLLTPIELVKCRMQVQTLYPSHPTPSAANTHASSTSAARISARNIHTNSGLFPLRHQPGPLELVVDVYRKEGLAAFWRGQTGTLLREAGGSAAWFGSYEYVNARFRKMNNRDTNTIFENMLAGACAGVMFNLSLFPADTIKSRMQTEALINGGSDTKQPQQGFLEIGKKIYKISGIKGLYRGCGITIARAAPSSAIIFVTYEKLKGAVHNMI